MTTDRYNQASRIENLHQVTSYDSCVLVESREDIAHAAELRRGRVGDRRDVLLRIHTARIGRAEAHTQVDERLENEVGISVAIPAIVGNVAPIVCAEVPGHAIA